jgi:hypothetical protein
MAYMIHGDDLAEGLFCDYVPKTMMQCFNHCANSIIYSSGGLGKVDFIVWHVYALSY